MSRYVSKSNVSVEEQNVIDATENTEVMDTPAGDEMTDVEETAAGEVLGDGETSPVEAHDASETPEALAAGVEVEFKKIAVGQTEIENKIQALDQIDNISVEMIKIIEKNGSLTAMEAMLVNVALDNATRKLPAELRSFDMPSLESYHTIGLASAATEISMEGVLDKISTLVNNISLSIQKQLKNALGFVASYTPLIERLLKRAQAVKSQIKNSNREAGLKEIKLKTAPKLAVDGRSPNGETTVKTLKYCQQCISEVMSNSAEDALIQFIKESTAAMMREGAAGKDDTSMWRMHGLKQIQVPALKYPDIFRLYPTIAKIDTAGVAGYADEGLKVKRSLPLFGGVAFTVFTNKVNPKTDNVEVKWVPGLNVLPYGDRLESNTVTVLTAREQTIVIDGVIDMLEELLSFWKSYRARNEKVYRMFQDAQKQWLSVKNNSMAGYRQRAIGRWGRDVGTMYKLCLFDGRYQVAMYAKTVTGALISYVEASARATQADSAE